MGGVEQFMTCSYLKGGIDRAASQSDEDFKSLARS